MTWQPRDGTEILASDYDAGEPFWPSWWQPLPNHPPLPEEVL